MLGLAIVGFIIVVGIVLMVSGIIGQYKSSEKKEISYFTIEGNKNKPAKTLTVTAPTAQETAIYKMKNAYVPSGIQPTFRSHFNRVKANVTNPCEEKLIPTFSARSPIRFYGKTVEIEPTF